MKRIVNSISLLLIAFTVAFSTVGCMNFGFFAQKESETDTESVSDSVSDTEKESDTEKGSDTGSGTEDLEGYTPLTEDGKPLYVIVYQSLGFVEGLTGSATAGDYLKEANNFAAHLESLAEGVDFSVVSDRKLSEQTLKIMAFGMAEGVNDDVYATIRYQDHAISKNDQGIGLAAYNSGTLTSAVKKLKAALKTVDGDIYVKTSALSDGGTSKYKINKITVDGVSIDQYTIFCDSAEKDKAQNLRTKICDVNGSILGIETGEATGPAIILNNVDNDSEYGIELIDGNIRITYGTDMTWKTVMAHITASFNQVEYMGETDLSDLVKVWSSSDERKIISFNVKNVWGPGTPGTRDNATAELVLGYLPDFVGLQEFDVPYRNADGGFISLVSKKYAEVEIEGVDKNNIWNPIFYLKDKYTVVESGFVYFPNSAAGSYESEYLYGTSDNTSKFRSLVWAVLEDTLLKWTFSLNPCRVVLDLYLTETVREQTHHPLLQLLLLSIRVTRLTVLL